jgi:hypothetical protein
MEQLKAKIQGIENEILHMSTSLDELRRLQEQISTKATKRSTLFTVQWQQFDALDEENEGKPLTGMLCVMAFPNMIAVDRCFFQILMRN